MHVVLATPIYYEAGITEEEDHEEIKANMPRKTKRLITNRSALKE